MIEFHGLVVDLLDVAEYYIDICLQVIWELPEVTQIILENEINQNY